MPKSYSSMNHSAKSGTGIFYVSSSSSSKGLSTCSCLLCLSCSVPFGGEQKKWRNNNLEKLDAAQARINGLG